MVAAEWATATHVGHYLSRADGYPHRRGGEIVLLDHVPRGARRILDLGTGDGRLLALLQVDRPDALGVGLDVSERMLDAARERFTGDTRKRAFYGEFFDLLEPDGVFANLEHVASAAPRLHRAFITATGETPEEQDPSDQLLDVEMALLAGLKPRVDY